MTAKTRSPLHWIAAACLVASTAAPLAAHAACGRVTVASMNWQSAEVLAEIDRVI